MNVKHWTLLHIVKQPEDRLSRFKIDTLHACLNNTIKMIKPFHFLFNKTQIFKKIRQINAQPFMVFQNTYGIYFD